MYDVIGHEPLRERLEDVHESFAVIGPPGVGKKGIVYEWAEGRGSVEVYDILTMEQAKKLAEESHSVEWMRVLINGDAVLNWEPLLKPIEEGHLRVAIWATGLPSTVASRIKVFGAGYLNEKEILQILAKSFPTYGPRPWLAKALMGHFGAFNYVYAAVHVFEEINSCLAGRTFPKVLKDQPVAVASCLKLAAAARLLGPNLPWSKSALEVIPRAVAWDILRGPFPMDKNEARNAATVFFSGVTGGRLG